MWWLLALVGALGVLVTNAGPTRDRDLHWHIEYGEAILDQRTVRPTVEWTVTNEPWTTTAWASEVLQALTYRLGGWHGIVAMRLLFAAILLALLARLVLAGRDQRAAVAVYLITAVTLSYFVLDRPQLYVLPILAMWAITCQRMLRGDQPALWPVVPLAWVAANLHGLWVLIPASLALLAIGNALTRPARWRQARRQCVAAVAAALAGACTPIGLHAWKAPLEVSEAARGLIIEWAVVEPLNSTAWAFDLLILVAVGAWLAAWSRNRRHSRGAGGTAMSPTTAPRTAEVIWVAGWAGYGFLAWRNIGPAALFIAPAAADALDRLLPRRSPGRLAPTWFMAVATAGVLATAGTVAAHDGLPAGPPADMVARAVEHPGSARMLVSWNEAGFVIQYGEGRARLLMDQRIDRYGHDRAKRHIDMLAAYAGWQAELGRERPGLALLNKREGLAKVIVTQAGWRVVLENDGYLLVEPPHRRS